MPSVFDDFFKPWNEWFDSGLTGRTMNCTAVNITEHQAEYCCFSCCTRIEKK
jgi:HSP20 family protein